MRACGIDTSPSSTTASLQPAQPLQPLTSLLSPEQKWHMVMIFADPDPAKNPHPSPEGPIPIPEALVSAIETLKLNNPNIKICVIGVSDPTTCIESGDDVNRSESPEGPIPEEVSADVDNTCNDNDSIPVRYIRLCEEIKGIIEVLQDMLV